MQKCTAYLIPLLKKSSLSDKWILSLRSHSRMSSFCAEFPCHCFHLIKSSVKCSQSTMDQWLKVKIDVTPECICSCQLHGDQF